VPLEYPLAIVAACLVKPYRDVGPKHLGPTRADVMWPVALGVATVGLSLGVQRLGAEFAKAELFLALGVPAFVCFVFASRRSVSDWV